LYPGRDVSASACRYALFILIHDFNIRDCKRTAYLNHLAVSDEVGVDCGTQKVDPDVRCWDPVTHLSKDGEVRYDVHNRGNWTAMPLAAAWTSLEDRLEGGFDGYYPAILVHLHKLEAKHLVERARVQILPQGFFDTIAIIHAVTPKSY
jgi:hypothetical protein